VQAVYNGHTELRTCCTVLAYKLGVAPTSGRQWICNYTSIFTALHEYRFFESKETRRPRWLQNVVDVDGVRSHFKAYLPAPGVSEEGYRQTAVQRGGSARRMMHVKPTDF